MKRYSLVAVVLLLLFSLAGCTPSGVPFTLVSPITTDYPNLYRNSEVSIQFSELTNSIAFSFTNESTEPVKIVWDNCAITDLSGQPSRVMHYGIRYVERDKSFPPSIVPPGQTLKEGVIPVDKVEYWGSYLGWVVLWIVPRDSAKTNAGKTISFLLCYEKAGLQTYETFIFKVFPDEGTIPSSVLDVLENAESDDITITIPLPSEAGISSVFGPVIP